MEELHGTTQGRLSGAQGDRRTDLGRVLGTVVDRSASDNAKGFLQQRGSAYNSYEDTDGKAAIAFGVYGVPETFFIDGRGTIVDKYVGPLDDMTLSEKLAAARK